MHEEVVIRHAASNQLQRNAPHCKPPAAPKRPPDRSQTAPAPACAYPALRLAITDEASPLALRSTRNRPRTAVRRGAARPRRSDQAAAGETLSRAGRRPHRRACMGCRAPAGAVHKNAVGRPSARSLGVAAQEVRMPAAPSSPCPRPRPASSVQCPVSSVRCPVRASSVHACLSQRRVSSVRCHPSVQVSAVRGPVWASGVCALPRPLCPAGVRSWSAAVGQAAVRLGWPGSAWSPAASMPGSSSA